VHNTFLLALVIVVAVGFDFTNGFHDTANAVAPSIATGALKPRMAVLLSSLLNIVGAFLSLKVAATVASGIVSRSCSAAWSAPLRGTSPRGVSVYPPAQVTRSSAV
jgi:PiT family inorganic phosphate transporter